MPQIVNHTALTDLTPGDEVVLSCSATGEPTPEVGSRLYIGCGDICL